MPTYDYRCPRGHEFEEFQSITAEPVAKCPKCGRRAKRQISGGSGLIFKGSGFYITDYKNKNAGASEKKESSKDGSSKNESASKDGTKPGSSKAPEPATTGV